jgi:hypothetical protein
LLDWRRLCARGARGAGQNDSFSPPFSGAEERAVRDQRVTTGSPWGEGGRVRVQWARLRIPRSRLRIFVGWELPEGEGGRSGMGRVVVRRERRIVLVPV